MTPSARGGAVEIHPENNTISGRNTSGAGQSPDFAPYWDRNRTRSGVFRGFHRRIRVSRYYEPFRERCGRRRTLIRATLTRMTVVPRAVRHVMVSCATAHPSSTATSGLT
jgi:hypothetical protein